MAWQHDNRWCARVTAVFGMIDTDLRRKDRTVHESVSDCPHSHQSNLGFERLIKPERSETEDADNESKKTCLSRVDGDHSVCDAAERCNGASEVSVSNESAHFGTVGADSCRTATANNREVPIA